MAKAPGTTFDQLPLAKMKHGLAKPIATIQCQPTDLSKRLGILFEQTQDDLDEVEAAVVRTASGRQFGLVSHQHQPKEGVDILTDEHSTDLAKDLQEVMGFLRIGREELSWVHPAIVSATAHAQTQSWSMFKKVVGHKSIQGSESEYPKSLTKDYKKFASEHSGKDVLSSDVEIKGSIKFHKELLIDGKFEGEIRSDGALTVGENADLRAEIQTKSITIYGKVQGNVSVSERCELKSKCTLQGDLKAARLIIEEGATFVGKSEVSSGMSVKAAASKSYGYEDTPEKSLARA